MNLDLEVSKLAPPTETELLSREVGEIVLALGGTAKEAEVMRLRTMRYTQGEIGLRFERSRGRIGQIEKRVVRMFDAFPNSDDERVLQNSLDETRLPPHVKSLLRSYDRDENITSLFYSPIGTLLSLDGFGAGAMAEVTREMLRLLRTGRIARLLEDEMELYREGK
jgi:hypothetical protein